MIKMQIQAESRRLTGQNCLRIVKVYDKTRIKSLSVANSFLFRKHEGIDTFQYSNKALADMLDESRAKCALTRIGVASIENTRENTCETQSEQQQSQKTSKKQKQNTNLACAMYRTSTLSSRIHVQNGPPYTQAYQKTSNPRDILKKKSSQTLPMQEIRKNTYKLKRLRHVTG